MEELLKQFEKSRQCPKCTNSYFTIEFNWMEKYTKSVYTCDSCNWSFVLMSNCTSPANVRDLSLSNQSTTSAPQTQSA
jgi:transposase-like protein